jgi:lysozyme family protein
MIFPEIFNRCILVILKNEGGYQCNPNDSGNWYKGKLIGTKFGIAARFFPNEDIKNLTIERAKEIYFQYYWFPMNLTGIVNADSILQIFDMGVNGGRKTAIILAQKLVKVKPDGQCGNITKGAINQFDGFLDAYKSARIEYYIKCAENPKQEGFLKGWKKRVSDCRF